MWLLLKVAERAGNSTIYILFPACKEGYHYTTLLLLSTRISMYRNNIAYFAYYGCALFETSMQTSPFEFQLVEYHLEVFD